MFINFDVNTGISINDYRKPNCQVGDLTDLLKALEENERGSTTSVCCSLEDAQALLKDVELNWREFHHSIDAVRIIIEEYYFDLNN